MGEVDGDLAFGVWVVVLSLDGTVFGILAIPGQDSPHAEFPGDTERERPDHSAWAKIGQLVAVLYNCQA